MKSTAIIVATSLAASVVIAAPLPSGKVDTAQAREANELEARRFRIPSGIFNGLRPILKDVGLGVAEGAGTEAFSDFFGGSSPAPASPADATAAQKRELQERKFKIGSILGPILKNGGLGVLEGAGTEAFSDFFGGASNPAPASATDAAAAQKRELQERKLKIGSFLKPFLKNGGLGVLEGAGTEAFSDFFGGASSPAPTSPTDATAAQKRELQERKFKIGTILKPFLKDIGLGVAEGAGTEAFSDFFGGASSPAPASPTDATVQKRGFGKVASNGVGNLIGSTAFDGLEDLFHHLFGGNDDAPAAAPAAQKRGFGKVASNGVGNLIGSTAFDGLEDLFHHFFGGDEDASGTAPAAQKRGFGKIAGNGVGNLIGSTAVDGFEDVFHHLFGGDDDASSAPAPPAVLAPHLKRAALSILENFPNLRTEEQENGVLNGGFVGQQLGPDVPGFDLD